MMNGNKKISILIPCYNEVGNVAPISEAVSKTMINELAQYDYEIIFIDNASNDGTRDVIRSICAKDSHIKAIFNVTNFGQFNSPFHGICEATGDCVIAMGCDFQDPVEMIVPMIREWENGHKIVCPVKTTSKENPIIYYLRSKYYQILKKHSTAHMIEHFTGFGLYDKSFVKLLRELDDPTPFLRGIVGEYGTGFNVATIEYEQAKRRSGKSHNNFSILYDAAMLSFTSYTKIAPRIATLFGGTVTFILLITVLAMMCISLIKNIPLGMGFVATCVFLVGATLLFFMGLMCEYVLSINTRMLRRPIVVEECRINFE